MVGILKSIFICELTNIFDPFIFDLYFFILLQNHSMGIKNFSQLYIDS